MKKIISAIFLLMLMMNLIFAEERSALLIANGKYEHFSSLKNPVPEAEDLAKSLKQLGFDVVIKSNLSKEQMLDSLEDFAKKVKGKGGIAFFHYGGHAVQVKGIDYLIPADANIEEEKRVQTRAVNLDEVMASMKGDANIVVLDASRDNPLPSGEGRSASRGLVPTNHKPNNSIIVYSAQAGSTAQDGVFTPLLTKMITQQKSFNQIIRDVCVAVKEKTNNMQIPSYDGSDNEICLAGSVAAMETVMMEKSKKEYEDLEKEIENIKSQMTAKQTEKDKQKALEELQKKESAAKQKKLELEEKQREIQAESEKNQQQSHLMFAETGNNGMVKLNKGGKPYMIVCDHEVTQSEYEAVMGINPSYNKAGGNLPVEMVSWYDAVKYCNKRSEMEGLTPCYTIKGNNVTWNRAADGYRLPTVDEYKDAAGLSAGNNVNDDNAWTLNNSDNKTHVVKQKKANSNNLYDMTGNVAEWCWSDNKSNKSYNVGAWNVPDINAGNINEQPAINKNPTLGFRLVRNADAQKAEQEKSKGKAKKQKATKNAKKTKEETPVIDIGVPSIDIDSVIANVAGRTFGKTVEIKNIKVHKTGILKNIRYSIKDMATDEVIADNKEITYQNSNVSGEYIVDPIRETIGDADKGRIMYMKLTVTDAKDQTAAISFPFGVDSTAPNILKEFYVTDESGTIGSGAIRITDNIALKEVRVNILSSDKSWKQDETLLSPDGKGIYDTNFSLVQDEKTLLSLDGKGLLFGDRIAIKLPKTDAKRRAVTYTITVTAKDTAGNEIKEQQNLSFNTELDSPFTVNFMAFNPVNSVTAIPYIGPRLVLDSNRVRLSDISNVVYAVMPVEATDVILASPQQRIEILGVEVNKEFGLWMMRFSSRDINRLSPGMTQFAVVGGVVGGALQNAGTFSIVNDSSEPY